MDEAHPDVQIPVSAAGPDPQAVRSEEQLLALYPTPVARTWAKESSVITPGYREMIAASPFCVIATTGPEGIDCSPRGDAPGFVRVLDERTLVIPDRRGNNRLDTLRNVVRDSRIGLVFLIPGVGEAVRVRGRATISTDPKLLQDNAVHGIEPVTVLVVTVDRIYFQCRMGHPAFSALAGAARRPGEPAHPRPVAGRGRSDERAGCPRLRHDRRRVRVVHAVRGPDQGLTPARPGTARHSPTPHDERRTTCPVLTVLAGRSTSRWFSGTASGQLAGIVFVSMTNR